MSAPSGSLQPRISHHPHLPAVPRTLLIALGVVAAWVVGVVGLHLMWEHAFGFTAGQAFVLSISLMAYLALLTFVMGAIVIVMRRGA